MNVKYDEAGAESILGYYLKNTYLSDSLTNIVVTSVNKDNNEMHLFRSSDAFRDINSVFILFYFNFFIFFLYYGK